PRDANGVEGRLEGACEALAAERVAPRREARVEGLDRQAEAFRVQLELLGDVLERRAAPPGARQDDPREERVGGARRGRRALAEEQVGDAPRLRAHDGRERQALRRLVGEAAAGLIYEDGAQVDERRARYELPRRRKEGRHQETREPPSRRAGLAPEAEAVARGARAAPKRERGDRRTVLRDQRDTG